MTEQEVTALGPAFAAYLRRFRDSFGQDRTAAHFDTYCRGLLSDLSRKSVEPLALAAGTAVRTLQEFLTTAAWDHESARDLLQRYLAGVLSDLPADPVGTVGVIDETSCRKKGDRTPGVQPRLLGEAEERPLHRVPLVTNGNVREGSGEQVGLDVPFGRDAFRHSGTHGS